MVDVVVQDTVLPSIEGILVGETLGQKTSAVSGASTSVTMPHPLPPRFHHWVNPRSR